MEIELSKTELQFLITALGEKLEEDPEDYFGQELLDKLTDLKYKKTDGLK